MDLMETNTLNRKIPSDVLPFKKNSIHLLSTSSAKIQKEFIHFSDSKNELSLVCSFGVHNLIGNQIFKQITKLIILSVNLEVKSLLRE
jgi:hypothetical protein